MKDQYYPRNNKRDAKQLTHIEKHRLFKSDLGLFNEFYEKPYTENEDQEQSENESVGWFAIFQIIIAPEK